MLPYYLCFSVLFQHKLSKLDSFLSIHVPCAQTRILGCFSITFCFCFQLFLVSLLFLMEQMTTWNCFTRQCIIVQYEVIVHSSIHNLLRTYLPEYAYQLVDHQKKHCLLLLNVNLSAKKQLYNLLTNYSQLKRWGQDDGLLLYRAIWPPPPTGGNSRPSFSWDSGIQVGLNWINR